MITSLERVSIIDALRGSFDVPMRHTSVALRSV